MTTEKQKIISCLEGRTFTDSSSILEFLYDHYGETALTGSKDITAGFAKLRKQLDFMGHDALEEVMTTVFDLCRNHEFNAFKDAIRIGYQLAHELSGKVK